MRTARSWITNIWDFMSRYNITMTGDFTEDYRSRRDDVYLMDLVNDLSANLQDKINNVRKYLNVITVADVMDVTGARVDRSYLKKLRIKFSRKSKLKFTFCFVMNIQQEANFGTVLRNTVNRCQML